jgi:exodeoxyribonuclease VII large subunit
MTTYTVGGVTRMVAAAIAAAFPDEIWVQGEIRDLNRAPSGHVYFSLTDPDSEETPAPMLPVTLFASEKHAVNRVLQRSGAVRMTDGVAVRIRGQIGHYAARGIVQLRMTWIDTDYTLGKLAAERERVIRSLDERGLLEKNRALPMPLVPLRVGLVTSAGSAADADFTHELDASGFAWELSRADARVQGVDAVRDVVDAIARLEAAGTEVIAIIRGGGAQTDLAAFDAEEIAVAIAECAVPVLTGIGHEIDLSIADLVARSYKTPTACAAALVARVAEFLARLDHLAVATRRVAAGRLQAATATVDYATARLRRSGHSAQIRAEMQLAVIERNTVRAGRSLLRRREDEVAAIGRRVHRAGTVRIDSAIASVDRMASVIGATSQRSIDATRAHIVDLERRMELLDPQRLLARGWSITRTAVGDLVTTPAAVGSGTVLRTTVADGDITSVVTEETDNGR